MQSHYVTHTCHATAHAAQRFSGPHWHIRGHTKRGQQPFVCKGERRTFKVAVFIKYGCKPVVVVLPAKEQPSSSKAASRAARGSSRLPLSTANLNGKLYCEIIQQNLMTGRHVASGGELGSRASKLMLVHDRDPSHTSTVFAAFASEFKFTAELLPAKAPDLSPLDFGFFPNVKKEWEKTVQKCRLGWEDQCKLLVDLLSKASPDKYILSIPRRIKRCIEKRGKHFEKM